MNKEINVRTNTLMLCFYILSDILDRVKVNYRPVMERGIKLKKASYKRLWKLLIDLEMNKKTLAEKSGVSLSTLAKMTRGDSVNVEILVRICTTLNCTMDDIMELIEP